MKNITRDIFPGAALGFFLAATALTPTTVQAQQWSGGPLSWSPPSGTPTTVVVTDSSSQWLATFTVGTRAVPMRGNVRAFLDPTLTAAVLTSNVYVRILPSPFQGVTDQVQQWLSNELLNDTSDDVLKIASEYVTGGPDSQTQGSYTPPPPAYVAPIYNGPQQIAGSSWYGPLIKPVEPGFDSNNMWVRHEGADWNDYLGITASYPNKNVAPVAANLTSLDCSGFMRMVWGYRGGIPLDITLGTTAGAIPRHSWQIFSSGPGVVVQNYTGVVPNPVDSIVAYTTPTPVGNAALTSLLPGDLVFFELQESANQHFITHVGMYMGKDSAGHYRFVSSTQKIDGPSFGLDGTGQGGRSILDLNPNYGLGDSHQWFWPQHLVAVRRF